MVLGYACLHTTDSDQLEDNFWISPFLTSWCIVHFQGQHRLEILKTKHSTDLVAVSLKKLHSEPDRKHLHTHLRVLFLRMGLRRIVVTYLLVIKVISLINMPYMSNNCLKLAWSLMWCLSCLVEQFVLLSMITFHLLTLALCGTYESSAQLCTAVLCVCVWDPTWQN